MVKAHSARKRSLKYKGQNKLQTLHPDSQQDSELEVNSSPVNVNLCVEENSPNIEPSFILPVPNGSQKAGEQPGKKRSTHAPRSGHQFKVGPSFQSTVWLRPVHLSSTCETVFPVISARIDRGFDLIDGEWIGYKRNYFTLVAAFEFEGIDLDIFSREKFYIHDTDGERKRISSFSLGLTSRCCEDNLPVALIQHTAKRDRGPLIAPPVYVAVPGQIPNHSVMKRSANIRNESKISSYNRLFFLESLQDFDPFKSILDTYPKDEKTARVAKYERIQFSSSINNRISSLAHRHFALEINLLGNFENGEQLILARTDTPPLTIRGRSPSNYKGSRGAAAEIKREAKKATLAAKKWSKSYNALDGARPAEPGTDKKGLRQERKNGKSKWDNKGKVSVLQAQESSTMVVPAFGEVGETVLSEESIWDGILAQSQDIEYFRVDPSLILQTVQSKILKMDLISSQDVQPDLDLLQETNRSVLILDEKVDETAAYANQNTNLNGKGVKKMNEDSRNMFEELSDPERHKPFNYPNSRSLNKNFTSTSSVSSTFFKFNNLYTSPFDEEPEIYGLDDADMGTVFPKCKWTRDHNSIGDERKTRESPYATTLNLELYNPFDGCDIPEIEELKLKQLETATGIDNWSFNKRIKSTQEKPVKKSKKFRRKRRRISTSSQTELTAAGINYKASDYEQDNFSYLQDEIGHVRMKHLVR